MPYDLWMLPYCPTHYFQGPETPGSTDCLSPVDILNSLLSDLITGTRFINYVRYTDNRTSFHLKSPLQTAQNQTFHQLFPTHILNLRCTIESKLRRSCIAYNTIPIRSSIMDDQPAKAASHADDERGHDAENVKNQCYKDPIERAS